MNKMCDYIEKYSTKNDSSKEILQFGIDMIKLSLIASLVGILIAGIMKMIPEALFFLTMFIPLRQNAGGYHTKHKITCGILSVIMYVFVLLLVKTFNTKLIIQLVFSIINAAIIIGLAPVGNKNNKLNYSEKNVYRYRTRNILVVEMLIFMLIFINGLHYWSNIIILAETVVSVLLCIGKLQEYFGEGDITYEIQNRDL